MLAAGLLLGLGLACVGSRRSSEAPVSEVVLADGAATRTVLADQAGEVAASEPTSMVPEPVAMVEVEIPEPAPPAAIEPPPWAGKPELEDKIRAVQPIVLAAASAQGVDPALINGLIWVESKFDPKARGPAGAQGLMQLMPKTADGLAKLLGRKRKSYDPDFNIHAGTLLIKRLLDRFDGDVSLALAAYNRGTGIVAGWVAEGQPLPERTQGFVDRVLKARTWFEQHPVVVASE